MLKSIQKQLNLIYLNNDEQTRLDRASGSTDLLDMAFVSPNLAKNDIHFLIGDGLGSNHLPTEASIDAPPISTPGSTRFRGFFLTQVHQ